MTNAPDPSGFQPPPTEDLNLLPADWVGDREGSNPTTEAATPAEPTTATPAVEGTTEPPSPEAAPAQGSAEAPVKDELTPLIETLLQDDTPDRAKDIRVEDVRAELAQEDSRLKQLETQLATLTPDINPDGTRLQDWKLEDGRNLYEIDRNTLNELVVSLQNDSQAVMADDIKRAWDQFQSNKANLARYGDQIRAAKAEMDLRRENLELFERGQVWIQKLKTEGFEWTPAHLQKADEYLMGRRQQSEAFRALTKDQQILEALQGTGIAHDIRAFFKTKAAPASTAPVAPDAQVSKSVVRQAASTIPAGFDFSESQIQAMPSQEFAKNEAAIDRAMAQGRIYNDLTET